MAKVLNPLLSVEARGKMEGLIYNTWHGISYVKAFSSPNQPNTEAQLLARSRMSSVAADWRSLTQAQRNTWATYADANPLSDWTGQPKRITAFNWYVRCNVQLERMGESAITDAPGVAAPNAVTGFVLADATGDITAAWTAPVTGLFQIELRILGPVSTGVDPKFEQAVFQEYMEPDETTPYIVVTAAATGRWRAWARVCDESTGLTSGWLSDQIDMA